MNKIMKNQGKYIIATLLSIIIVVGLAVFVPPSTYDNYWDSGLAFGYGYSSPPPGGGLDPLPNETHTLEIIISPEGTGTVDLYPGGGIYGEGRSVKLTAEGIGDYSFSSWSGDFTGSDNPDNITMDTDKVVTANFAVPGAEPGTPAATPTPTPTPEGNVPVNEQGVTTGGVAITGGCLDCGGTLIIPEGTTALDADGNPLNNVTVGAPAAAPDDPADGNILGICDFGPDGATFDPPLTVKMSYDPAELPEGVAEEDLVLAYYDESTGQWVELENIVVDTVNHTISGSIAHFTKIGALAQLPPEPTPTPTPEPTPTPTVEPTPTPTQEPPTPEPTQEPPPPVEEDDDGMNLWIVIVPILIVLIIVGGGYLYWKNQQTA